MTAARGAAPAPATDDQAARVRRYLRPIPLESSSSSIWRLLRDDPDREGLLVAWRERLSGPLAEAEAHRLRRVLSEGPDGFLLWVDLCCWTFDPRRPAGARRVPFITWPVQAAAGRELFAAIAEGRDVLIDKSRDMGATWLCLAAFAWCWIFVPDTPLLVASRKEEYVDGRGNPDTLFWKLDLLAGRQPGFLRPRMERRHMHLANLDNGSVIDGESTNADLGRGGRRKAILLDEFASVENGAEILAATADAAPCRVFNSTPKGRGNAFADVRFSGKVQVVTLHWKDHPAKGRGAVLAGGRWSSPWYQSECARRTSRKEIAQELDIDYLASGDAFFDLDVLQALRASGQVRPPLARGELRYRACAREDGAFHTLADIEWLPEGGRRRLALWTPLTMDNGRLTVGEANQGAGGASRNCQSSVGGCRFPAALCPRRDRNYVAFVDVAHGTGASNSVIKVADAVTREEVAAFVCPDTPPHELARFAVAICMWFGPFDLAQGRPFGGAGGRQRPCLLGWEANGPGGIFGLEVHRLGYRAILGNPDPAAPWRPEDGGVGWHSSRERKLDLLGDLRRALARGDLVIHDEATVAELEQYIYYPSGAVGPSALVSEGEGARAAHGDRVIASAGLLLCLANQPGQGADGGAPPAGSFADRQEARRHARSVRERWSE